MLPACTDQPLCETSGWVAAIQLSMQALECTSPRFLNLIRLYCSRSLSQLLQFEGAIGRSIELRSCSPTSATHWRRSASRRACGCLAGVYRWRSTLRTDFEIHPGTIGPYQLMLKACDGCCVVRHTERVDNLCQYIFAVEIRLV